MMSSDVFNLPVPSGPINMGQGEYVAFYSDGKKISYDLYGKIYQILQDNNPLNLAKNQTDVSERYSLITKAIKVIDPELEVAFIPRTLYELFYIKKLIHEDVVGDKFCPYNTPGGFQNQTNEQVCKIYKESFTNESNNSQSKMKIKHCWHLASFYDCGDCYNEGVKLIAYRLNKAIVKELKPEKNGFLYDELILTTRKILEFLMDYGKKALNSASDNQSCAPLLMNKTSTTTIYDHSLATIFARAKKRTKTFDYLQQNCMRIEEKEYDLAMKALHLDCSQEARDSAFIYRGADFEKDSVSTNQDSPYSLSFGTSLWAGVVFDRSACAMSYMSSNIDAYAIAVPYILANKSSIYIPPGNTLTQLLCKGETWHSRTKVPEGSLKIGGLRFCSQKEKNLLYSNKTLDELKKEFTAYKKQAIFLSVVDLKKEQL